MIYYLYAEENQAFVEKNKMLEVWSSEIHYRFFDALKDLDPEQISHLLVTGCGKEIKEVMSFAYLHNISMGIVPLPEQKELKRTLDLPLEAEEAISLALEKSEKKIDLLFCDETIVLQEVVIGDAPPLDHFDTVLKGKTVFDRIQLFWMTLRKVKQLKHTRMKMVSAKENEVELSAVGLVGLEYNNATFAAKLLSSKLSAIDGKLLLVILSPASIMQYMGYLFQSLVSYITPKAMPNSVGYISSAEIFVETEEPLQVRIDSSELSKTPVALKVREDALALSVGEKFWQRQSGVTSSKDSIKVDHLPSDKESSEYLSEGIPLFTHAGQEQYASLFTNLREEGKINTVYIILLILSTMIATFGLFINSSSVVIGAMLLAPLMQPIVSLSMGVLRQDVSLEINGIKSIFWGVAAVIFTAAMIALFVPIERMTLEMTGRITPTILDLFVAIVSGVAAAYVKSNEKILSSLAGVAIAVALVPPLAVAGIGLGWGHWHMFMMAFLLFITNLVGIVFAAAFTFLLLGFSPLRMAKKGIVTWLMIVALVSIPLYSAFEQMKKDIHVQSTLSNRSFRLKEHEVMLTHVEFLHRQERDVIRCEVVSSGILSKSEKGLLKEEILKSVNKEAEVIVTFRYRL